MIIFVGPPGEIPILLRSGGLTAFKTSFMVDLSGTSRAGFFALLDGEEDEDEHDDEDDTLNPVGTL
jgi:hypothetical protein